MYNWRQSLHHEHSSMQAGGQSVGIDIMQRIVALLNCECADKWQGDRHSIYILWRITQMLCYLYRACSCNQCIVQHTHSVIHHLLHRPLSIPTCFGPEVPSSGSRYNKGNMPIPDWLWNMCPRSSRSILECTETISEFGSRSIHHFTRISLGNSRVGI